MKLLNYSGLRCPGRLQHIGIRCDKNFLFRPVTVTTRDFRQFVKCLTSKMARLMFRVFIRDPNTWYGHRDPVLGATRVPLVSTPWQLAAIGHLGLHIHRCRAWLCCSQVSKIWNSESTLAVEIVNHFDGSLFSRDHIHLCLHA